MGNGNNIGLTDNQQYVFDKFKAFIKNNEQKVFILNGHAGTGKTTLIRFFIDELKAEGRNYKLMASTGIYGKPWPLCMASFKVSFALISAA
jgi:Cdc6-like AAA superfamily ATPase